MNTAEPSDFRNSGGRPGLELITDPARVQHMLQGLLEGRCLLSARLDEGETWYNTTLLDVDPAAGVVLLDELSPRRGHQQVRVGLELRVLGVLNGVPTRFTARVLDVAVQDGIAFYRVALPSRIEYQQRRAFFRAYVPRSLELKVRLLTSDQIPLTARLVDLSLGGLGMFLPQNSPLFPLDVVTIERLDLPEGQSVSCTAEIRYTQPEYGQKLIRAGGRFIGLEGQDARTLLRAILSLEREQIRKRPLAA